MQCIVGNSEKSIGEWGRKATGGKGKVEKEKRKAAEGERSEQPHIPRMNK